MTEQERQEFRHKHKALTKDQIITKMIEQMDEAEQAYRTGFPCHLSADYDEDEPGDGEAAGYVFGAETQHCAGALGTFANEYRHDGMVWPAIDNSEAMAEQIIERMGDAGLAMCFESEQEFIDANDG